jgi:hypothetical protein
MTRLILLPKGAISAKCDKLGLVVEKNKQIAFTTTSRLTLPKQLPTFEKTLKFLVAAVETL